MDMQGRLGREKDGNEREQHQLSNFAAKIVATPARDRPHPRIPGFETTVNDCQQPFSHCRQRAAPFQATALPKSYPHVPLSVVLGISPCGVGSQPALRSPSPGSFILELPD